MVIVGAERNQFLLWARSRVGTKGHCGAWGGVYMTVLLSKLGIVPLKGELLLFVSYTSKIKNM